MNDIVVLCALQVEFAGGALRCGEYVTLRKVTDASQKVRKINKFEHDSYYCLLNLNHVSAFIPQTKCIFVCNGVCLSKCIFEIDKN